MASRRNIYQSKLSLKNDLREQYRTGQLVPGEPVASLRDMAERYGMSTPTVTKALQELVDEGVLHTISRVGTFVGPPRAMLENYLTLDDGTSAALVRTNQFFTGFEDRIAQMGGASMRMSPAQLRAAVAANDLPPLAGVLEVYQQEDEFWSDPSFGDRLARVRFCLGLNADRGFDCVSFDDVNGGRRATQHLMALGHQRIAFLGLHSWHQHDARLDWSQARENGWREAMAQANLPHDDLSFDPDSEPQNEASQTEIDVAHEASRNLVQRNDITAVVAANDHAALGLIRALRAARIPSNRWPSIVGFDDDSGADGQSITSLRLPWNELGRAAAELLWERRHGRLPQEPQHRLVEMRLITRLTCRKNWSAAAGQTVLATVAA